MRILQVIQTLKRGGAERICADLSAELVARGHYVKIILLQDYQEIAQSEYEYLLSVQPLVQGERPVWIKSLPSLVPAFRKVYSEGWDIVHCHMDGALIVAGLAGAKHICYTVHNSLHGHWEGRGMHRIRSGLEWWITRRSGVVIAGCSPAATEWAERHLGGRHKTIRCVSNGINLRRFTYRSERWLPNSPARILMIGKLTPQKNHEMALAGVSELVQQDVNVELQIAGEGALREYLENRAREIGISKQVHFLGNCHDVATLYQDSDLFWLTSLHEGLPIVLLEAMASGLPAIVTNVPGIKEVAEPVGIPMVPVRQIDRLAAVTRAVLNLEFDIESVRQSCRTQVEGAYSTSAMTDNYMTLFADLSR